MVEAGSVDRYFLLTSSLSSTVGSVACTLPLSLYPIISRPLVSHEPAGLSVHLCRVDTAQPEAIMA